MATDKESNFMYHWLRQQAIYALQEQKFYLKN